MLKSIFLLKFHYRGVFPLVFLEAQALCKTTQNIFPSNPKTRRNSKIKKENFMIFIAL